MTGNEYEKGAMRTNDGKSTDRLINAVNEHGKDINVGGIFHACLGMAGEVGELNDLVKKAVFHETKVDETHLKKELGDVMWYIAMFAYSMGWDLDEILEMNIQKLKNRYPEGFDVEKANNRKKDDI